MEKQKYETVERENALNQIRDRLTKKEFEKISETCLILKSNIEINVMKGGMK